MEVADERLELFAVTAPGLERIAAAELSALGIEGAVSTGGVSWSGPQTDLYRANLHLRTASRVVARVAGFRARTFFELERHAARVAWGRWLRPGQAVRLRVTSRKSRLYHEGAIEERLRRSLESGLGALPETVGERGHADAEGGGEAGDPAGSTSPLLVVRFLRDTCTVSVDSSGDLLHRRGYREAVARAPVRETLAAAMLLASGWKGDAPLLDPFCGSGTIAIEAALLARNVPPGLANPDLLPRRYAFLDWPAVDRAAWETVVERARAEVRHAPTIRLLGSDRDAGAIEAAQANACRAGVADDVAFGARPLSAAVIPDTPGWLVTNPPYGVRVGERRRLRDLYAAFGHLARERLGGWRIALLAAEPSLIARTGLEFQELLRTRNGGIAVRLLVA